MAASAIESATATVSSVAARHGHRLRSHRAAPTLRTAAGNVSKGPVSRVFTAAGIGPVRHLIEHAGHAFGLTGQALPDFVLAVQELMTNAIRYGGGWGRVRLHRDGQLLVCAVTDRGPGLPGDLEQLAELPDARSLGGRGLFLARQLTDGLNVSSSSAGVTVTVTMNVPAPAPR